MEDFRQSPLGFFNLGIAYLDAADALASRHFDKEDDFRLAFEHPVRHLYAHAWELLLKACLFAQGIKPSEMKRSLGHSLTKAWALVDQGRWPEFNLKPELLGILQVLDRYHPTKEYAYPVVRYRQDLTIAYVRAASQRFRISRANAVRLFGSGIEPRQE